MQGFLFINVILQLADPRVGYLNRLSQKVIQPVKEEGKLTMNQFRCVNKHRGVAVSSFSKPFPITACLCNIFPIYLVRPRELFINLLFSQLVNTRFPQKSNMEDFINKLCVFLLNGVSPCTLKAAALRVWMLSNFATAENHHHASPIHISVYSIGYGVLFTATSFILFLSRLR